MELKYQDRNLITTYLQIYLRDYYGLTVHKVIKRNSIDPDEYELTLSDPIKVTGYLNNQTYSAIAMYMLRNYPNEMYPSLWQLNTANQWAPTLEIYNDYIEEIMSSDEQHVLRKDVVIPFDNEGDFIKVIASNMENASYNPDTISVPRRVLSYLFGEVVSPLSTPEEILRVKAYLGNISYTYFGVESYSEEARYIARQISAYLNINTNYEYDDTFKNIIWQLQNLYLQGHQDEMPEQFMDFKATGYVDPWTEHILKGGSEHEYAG